MKPCNMTLIKYILRPSEAGSITGGQPQPSDAGNKAEPNTGPGVEAADGRTGQDERRGEERTQEDARQPPVDKRRTLDGRAPSGQPNTSYPFFRFGQGEEEYLGPEEKEANAALLSSCEVGANESQ
jgi:hypothetical protein